MHKEENRLIMPEEEESLAGAGSRGQQEERISRPTRGQFYRKRREGRADGQSLEGGSKQGEGAWKGSSGSIYFLMK